MTPEQERLSRSRRTVQRLGKPQIARLMQFIDENIGGDISVARLSLELRMSSSHFSHRFKETLGVSPHAFVANRRVMAAARLLTRTEISLEELAERVGFSSVGHFRRRFRRYLGCNPSEIRASIPNAAIVSILEKENQWQAVIDLPANSLG